MEVWQKQAREALTGMGYRLDQGIVAGGRALAGGFPDLALETKDTDLFIFSPLTPEARRWLENNSATLVKESKYTSENFDSRNYHVGDLDLIFLYAVPDKDALFRQFDLGICCVSWSPAALCYTIDPRAARDYTERRISVWLPTTDNRISRAEKYATKLGWPLVWPGGKDPRTFGAVAEDDCDPFF